MRLWGAALSLIILAGAGAAEAAPQHGLSAFGDLKYPADFSHFDYVNPDAPKGGRIATIGTGANLSFDSFNGFILKGDAAQGLDLLFDSLMVRAGDEPDAVYGLVAKTADVAADRLSVTFVLRPEARFADGSALTAADVCDSFALLKDKGAESIRITIRDVIACEAPDAVSVIYRFAPGARLRDLPLVVAGLPIFSKAYYATHDFSQTTLEPPLGSGPYVIGDFRQGQWVSYKRRADYWAKDLPVNRGRYNFDEIRFEYFRDRMAGLEALKAGILDLREEFSSKSWATEYDLPAFSEGRLIRATLPDDTMSGAQGFFLNLRRPQFQDVRVRQAFELAFDFEWSNANLFYGLYRRTQSVFENSPLKAQDAAGADELALLSPFKDTLPAEVFGPAYLPPVSDGSGSDRKLLRQASALLDAAGYKVKDGLRVDASGVPLKAEFLLDDPSFERITGPYLRNLKLLGIDASIREVDSAQYQDRLKTYDFDIVSSRFVLGQTPGVELEALFGSPAAKAPGSYNLAGIADPAVDALIAKVVSAPDRGQLATAARALDRVLRAQHFWVPQWYKASYTVAYWDQFGSPAVKPRYDRGILDCWWVDADKAAQLKRGP